MNALWELAEACGVERGYWDIHGTWHEAKRETLEAVLAAMGHAACDERAARHGLEALRAKREDMRLPPAISMVSGHEKAVSLSPKWPPNAQWRVTAEDGRLAAAGRRREAALHLPGNLPFGYYRLEVDGDGGASDCLLAVAPERCYLPPDFADQRIWGLMVPLYGLNPQESWGIGDFGDTARLGAWAARDGASAIGINPLHAVSPLYPEQASPYFPSSRLFLDFAYLDIPALPEFRRSLRAQHMFSAAVNQKTLIELRRSRLTDHARLRMFKENILREIYDHLPEPDPSFENFRRAGGRRLWDFAAYEVLAEHFGASRWRDWPHLYQDPRAPAVADFIREHQDRLRFRCFLQWLCSRQLEQTADRMKALGLSIGLYGDMALGVDPMGADAWMKQNVYCGDAALGAPPDDFNLKGQDWGVAAVRPQALLDDEYAAFIGALRASMAHRGLLRLDHVMALERAFWVPAGMSPQDGTYVRYPMEDLFNILALESVNHETVVIGEDLGTVTPELRRRMHMRGLLSYKVLYFEKEKEGFRAPESYPHQAVACAGTHDLPPLKGYWRGWDIEMRARLKLYDNEDAKEHFSQMRRADKAAISHMLEEAGLWLRDVEPEADFPAFVQAIHLFLARCGSWLATIQLDDLCGETASANMPGTVDEYPNWRRKMHVPLEEILTDDAIKAALLAFARERAG